MTILLLHLSSHNIALSKFTLTAPVSYRSHRDGKFACRVASMNLSPISSRRPANFDMAYGSALAAGSDSNIVLPHLHSMGSSSASLSKTCYYTKHQPGRRKYIKFRVLAVSMSFINSPDSNIAFDLYCIYHGYLPLSRQKSSI